MACGACGKKRDQSRQIQVIRPGAGTKPVELGQGRKVPVQSAVKVQIKRCPKCSWPMNSMRRYEGSKAIQVWACMNRKCNHREES